MDLEKTIHENSTQKIREIKPNHPVIHFSKDARAIFMEGFKFGASPEDIDITFDTSKKDKNGDIIRKRTSKGINYAFDTLSYSFEHNCNDYEYGMTNGMGMYADTAIICLADVIKTQHAENFEQCLFNGKDVELKTMILLKNKGEALNEDGEPLLNELEEEYEKWSAYSKIEGSLVKSEDNLTLEECIEKSIQIMMERKRYPENISEYNALYNPSLNTSETALTMQEAKMIVNEVRNEINDEHSLNFSFVDYCDICAERVEEKLLARGYECEIKNNFYIHKYPDSDLDAYGHNWVECDGIILDPSRDQFDSNQYVQRKELTDNYKETPDLSKRLSTSKKLKF